MNKKLIKNYVYTGLGFPIELHNVEVVQFDGEIHPKIDVRKISDSVIKSLVLQKDRLTGNQIKFIRTYFSMSLREFAKVVNESHMAVKKWEDFEDEPTNMDRNIEIMLRLYIYDHVVIKTKTKDHEKIKFYDKYLMLTKMFLQQKYVA
jgi:DNA-binding transcriptional regulator YiaG